MANTSEKAHIEASNANKRRQAGVFFASKTDIKQQTAERSSAILKRVKTARNSGNRKASKLCPFKRTFLSREQSIQHE